MKSKLKTRIPTTILTLIGTLVILTAALARAADTKNAANPANGLPAPPASSPWKEPNWKDPDQVLPEVSFDGLPLDEVAKSLRVQFQNAFDVVIPSQWRDTGAPFQSIEPQVTTIKMQLKNVRASEVFNAMNLLFETENTPLRWDLTMNGNRPTVVLHVIPALVAASVHQPPQRMIFFVGELLGDEKSGGMSMEQLVKTISEVYEMGFGTSQGPISGHLQFHKQSQLLIATGSPDQIAFVEQTIAALGRKRGWSQSPKALSADANAVFRRRYGLDRVPNVTPGATPQNEEGTGVGGRKAGESKPIIDETKPR